MQKRIYFENLDGLRFLCFLSVFFFHSFYTDFDYIKNAEGYRIVKNDVFGNGNIGVNFFFVLSGFLITFLLIEEKKLNGQINLKHFWIRRILRIWPLYYACVFFGFFIFPILKQFFGQIPNETASIGYYLLFLNNFDFINKGLPDASVLGVLWSVAIEEQFYLIWPVILYLLPIKKYWIAFTAVIGISLIYRACNDFPLLHEHHTFSCMGDLAIGAFGAWLVSEKDFLRIYIQRFKRRHILAIYFLFLLMFFFRDDLFQTNYFVRIFERSMLSVLILAIILEQNYSENSFFKFSRFKILSKLGVISYGLYCFHFIGILIAINLTKKMHLNEQLWEVLIIDTTIALIITILISYISYRFFEKPFLNLKNRFSTIIK